MISQFCHSTKPYQASPFHETEHLENMEQLCKSCDHFTNLQKLYITRQISTSAGTHTVRTWGLVLRVTLRVKHLPTWFHWAQDPSNDGTCSACWELPAVSWASSIFPIGGARRRGEICLDTMDSFLCQMQGCRWLKSDWLIQRFLYSSHRRSVHWFVYDGGNTGKCNIHR